MGINYQTGPLLCCNQFHCNNKKIKKMKELFGVVYFGWRVQAYVVQLHQLPSLYNFCNAITTYHHFVIYKYK